VKYAINRLLQSAIGKNTVAPLVAKKQNSKNRKIKRDFRYAKTDRERQLLRTRLTIIRDLRQHSGLYADLKKGCKTCRFWNKGKCNLGNKKENCKSWEQDPYLWVTEDRRGRKKAEDDYGELGFDSEEGDREDVYNDQENW